MPLRSSRFRGDPKLEAALVSDPAHIKQGDVGDHVGKVQEALNALDDAGLDADGIYGARTAQAVKAYKTARAIINFSYQTTADDIVGKMTMARLDEELYALEQAQKDDREPMIVQPVSPLPQARRGGPQPLPPEETRAAFRPMLSFSIGSGLGVFADVTPANVPTPNIPKPTWLEVVIDHPSGTGSFRVLRGKGATVTVSVRKASWSLATAIEITGRTGTPVGDAMSFPVDSDEETFQYKAASAVGQSFVNVDHPTKFYEGLSILTLTRAQYVSAGPIYSPHRDGKGLVSVEGTPLNYLPGRKINLFGEQETFGFTDYGSDISHCGTRGSRPEVEPLKINGVYQRPWTRDPRAGVGIENGSIENICFRGSPINLATIHEIQRIAKRKCRVTFSVSKPNFDFMKAELKTSITEVEVEGVLSQKADSHLFGVYRL